MRGLLVLLLLSAPASATPATYGGPPPPRSRTPFEAQIETLTGDIAVKAGHLRLEPDARLGRAARAIAERLTGDERPPNELVQAALWQNGVVEPPPHLILAGSSAGAGGALLVELRAQLEEPIARGRFRRVGCAVTQVPGGTRVLIALQESFVDLLPIPRAVAAGAPIELAGAIHGPYQNPEAFVTAPDGNVTRVPLGRGGNRLLAEANRFRGRFRAGPARGAYQVELVAEDRFGATVLANFPVYAGVTPPASLPAPAVDKEPSVTDAAGAETAIARLVNADRARAGLPPLAFDSALAQVARAHALDMHSHNFLGHVSPTTGTPADRVRAAGLDAQVVMENVARAYSPSEAERGLMDSPGHRANILSREPTRLGVGVVMAGGQGVDARALLVTQLFSRPTDAVGADSASEVRRRIDALRRGRGLRSLDGDPALDAIAGESAQGVAKGALPPDRAGQPLERELGRLAARYRDVRSLLAVTGSLSQVTEGIEKQLLDPALSATGIGLANGRRPDGSAALFAVLVLATRR